METVSVLNDSLISNTTEFLSVQQPTDGEKENYCSSIFASNDTTPEITVCDDDDKPPT
jgi:hypothetical protein